MSRFDGTVSQTKIDTIPEISLPWISNIIVALNILKIFEDTIFLLCENYECLGFHPQIFIPLQPRMCFYGDTAG